MYFGVDPQQVKADVLGQCYQSIFNLKKKLASEMQEVWELAQRAGALTSEEKVKFERYKHIETRIESAILELDRTIMIFSISK